MVKETMKSARQEALDPFAGMVTGRPIAGNRPVVGRKPDVPTALELGGRFRDLRLREGLSLNGAAKRFGSTPRTLARFEREGKVSGELLLRLVSGLSSASSFADAFREPLFSNIRQVIVQARARPK